MRGVQFVADVSSSSKACVDVGDALVIAISMSCFLASGESGNSDIGVAVYNHVVNNLQVIRRFSLEPKKD